MTSPQEGLAYELAPNIDGLDNITLYRGLSGSEYSDGFLFMTDSPESVIIDQYPDLLDIDSIIL